MATSEGDSERKTKTPFYSLILEEEKQSKDLSNLQLIDVSYGFASFTGFHGIPNIYNARGYGKKMFWTVITLVMTAFCANNVYENVQALLGFNVDVNVYIKTASQIEMPAVTFCNLNAFRLSAIPQDILGPLTNASFSSRLDTTNLFNELINEVPLADRITQGHSFSDFILSCHVAGKDCRQKDKWQAIWNWKYGNCYIFHVDAPSPTHVSTKPGNDHGLEVVLNIESSEYLPVLSDTIGARVSIHHTNRMPFPENDGIVVAPGTAVSLAIQKAALSRVGGRYSPCYDATVHDYNVNIFEETYTWTNYSRATCQVTCLQQMLTKSCNCYDAKYPALGKAITTPNTVACNTEDPVQTACVDNTLNEFIKDTSCTHCLQSCQEETFDATFTYSMWPAPGYKDTLLRSFDQNLTVVQDLVNGTTQISENLVKVEIYFAELTYVSMEESIAYTTSQFLSDLGGAIGLWIGASVLSVAELLEWLVDGGILFAVKYCCTKSKNYGTSAVTKPV